MGRRRGCDETHKRAVNKLNGHIRRVEDVKEKDVFLLELTMFDHHEYTNEARKRR